MSSSTDFFQRMVLESHRAVYLCYKNCSLSPSLVNCDTGCLMKTGKTIVTLNLIQQYSIFNNHYRFWIVERGTTLCGHLVSTIQRIVHNIGRITLWKYLISFTQESLTQFAICLNSRDRRREMSTILN